LTGINAQDEVELPPERDKNNRESVMPGLVPGIHVLETNATLKTRMAGTSPAMTTMMIQFRFVTH